MENNQNLASLSINQSQFEFVKIVQKMKNLFRYIYRRLPVIRELSLQTDILKQICWNLQSSKSSLNQDIKSIKAAALVQALEVIKASDPRFKDPRRLLIHGAQYWSQNYEDGMIEEIFRRIGATNKTFVEIGVGDGSENNTTNLLSQGWSGWWFEGDPKNCKSIVSSLCKMPSVCSRLELYEKYVSPSTIQAQFDELKIPKEVDLLSLDIDQDTYHVWRALKNFRPKVVVVEYNAAIPAHQSWIHPYIEGKSWDGTQAFGASLKAFELLGAQLEYSLVGCDIIGVNAFFIRNDVVADHFLAPFTSENHYEPPRYDLWNRWARSPALYCESLDNCMEAGLAEHPPFGK